MKTRELRNLQTRLNPAGLHFSSCFASLFGFAVESIPESNFGVILCLKPEFRSCSSGFGLVGVSLLAARRLSLAAFEEVISPSSIYIYIFSRLAVLFRRFFIVLCSGCWLLIVSASTSFMLVKSVEYLNVKYVTCVAVTIRGYI